MNTCIRSIDNNKKTDHKRYDKREDGNMKKSNKNKQFDINKSKDDGADFINIRLCAYEKEYCNNGYLSSAYYILKQADDEEMSCWAELSSLVRSKKAVGFPLLKGTKRISIGSMLYFEQFKNNKVVKLNPYIKCLNDNIIFQVVVILYSMYKRGIYSDEFTFDLVSIPKTNIVFCVNQLMFNICTDILVVLSVCGNRLYRTNLPQSCYLDYIHHNEITANRGYEMSNYFFEWLIKNHLSLLTKQNLDIFKVKKKYVSGSTANRALDPGTLIYIPKDDLYIVGISLTDVSINDNVRVLFSMDGVVLEIEDFNISNIFIAGELFTRSQSANIII
ncbi:virion protein [Yokapox virus]|uniref:Virion protein n=1 Tax=Yokapox virus TaxID=1076255 RepID=G3EIE8_9POXV|nr:virion protein [Yokapox virus]AEN03659.1 virion protein [Yokapox virus]